MSPLFAVIWAVALGASALTLAPGDVHLFVDLDGLDVPSVSNASIVLGSVLKTYPVAVASEHPWESTLHFYTSMVAVPAQYSSTGVGQFMLYYSCTYSGASSMNLCLAVSGDGVGGAWSKPLSSQYTYQGQPTNIVFQVNTSSLGSWPGSVLLDTGPGVPASERFKLSYEGQGAERVMYLAYSSDGVGWSRREPEVPVIPVRLFSDTQTAVLWDGTRGLYSAYGRKDSDVSHNATLGCEGNYPSLRRVLLATSNGSAWGNYSEPVEVLTPGYPDAYNCLDIYNPAPIVQGSTTLLLPSSFRHYSTSESSSSYSPSGGGNATSNDGVLDVRLAVSRDGVTYSYVSRDAFLPRGVGYRDPHTGAYSLVDSDLDAGFVFATAGGLVDMEALAPSNATPPFPYRIPSKRVGLLYWGGQRTHGGAVLPGVWQGVLRADMRREGWASLSSPAGDPVGAASFRTLPLLVPFPATACTGSGQQQQLWLLLNTATSVGGQVTVSILAPGSLQPLAGYGPDMAVPYVGDAVRVPVGWAPGGNGTSPALTHDLAPLAGQQVVLAVTLTHARLYAWEVQCV